MSKTYRKYPTIYWKSNGEYYGRRQDLPQKDWWIPDWHWETKYDWKRVFYDYIDKRGSLNPYFKMEWVPHRVRVESGWRNIGTDIDSDLVLCFGEKSTEGWNNNSRSWCSRGVGKEWKQLRNRKERAVAKNIIRGHWLQGDLEPDMPQTKTTDRWDYW